MTNKSVGGAGVTKNLITLIGILGFTRRLAHALHDPNRSPHYKDTFLIKEGNEGGKLGIKTISLWLKVI